MEERERNDITALSDTLINLFKMVQFTPALKEVAADNVFVGSAIPCNRCHGGSCCGQVYSNWHLPVAARSVYH